MKNAHKIPKKILSLAVTLFVPALFFISNSCIGSPENLSPALASPPLSIASLGDSYASGSGITPIANPTCDRSTQNYAHIAARRLGATLQDVSCDGATTYDFTHNQYDSLTGNFKNPPQFDILRKQQFDVVLVAIGGNDGKYISSVEKCALETLMNKNNCPNTQRALRERRASTVSVTKKAYQQIRQLQPNAHIIGINYGKLMDEKTCTAAPFPRPVAHWITSLFDEMANTTRTAVHSVHGSYIDSISISKGHDICTLHPWYVGIIMVPGQGKIAHPKPIWHNMVGQKIASVIRNHHR